MYIGAADGLSAEAACSAVNAIKQPAGSFEVGERYRVRCGEGDSDFGAFISDPGKPTVAAHLRDA